MGLAPGVEKQTPRPLGPGWGGARGVEKQTPRRIGPAGRRWESGRRALQHPTDTGRASSRAGAGKVEEPPAVGPDHEFNVRGRSRVCQASYLFLPVTQPTALRTGLLVCLLIAPHPAPAQGLPAYSPVNPVADSRTGLGFEPFRTPRPGRWTGAPALA